VYVSFYGVDITMGKKRIVVGLSFTTALFIEVFLIKNLTKPFKALRRSTTSV
jgi:hypothetical protein